MIEVIFNGTPQNIVIRPVIDVNNEVIIGFFLVDVEQKEQNECLFPEIISSTIGLSLATSARLVWKNSKGSFSFTDTLADKTKTVYNIPRSQCLGKNEFQLYITLTVDNVDTEYFVVTGLVYIYT